MTSFRTAQLAKLSSSGWAQCPSIVAAVAAAELPAITPEYLGDAVSSAEWSWLAEAVAGLRTRFATARFAAAVDYGVLLVPDPGKLDTRRALPATVRADQLVPATEDVFDARLPAGLCRVSSGRDWTPVATVVGRYGPALGSCQQVNGADAGDFAVTGQDTRAGMTRQLWGARVLQCGRELPDCEHNESWTFTLFPAEPRTEGLAESGTVLKGRVRFRLGKPDRGIGSARVAPAVLY